MRRWWTLASCVAGALVLGCGRPNTTLPPPPRTGPSLVFDRAPRPGEVCPKLAPGRGCRTSPFRGTCGSYFSATSAEFEHDLEHFYLGLRAPGDRRPFPAALPLFPEARGRGFVGSGLSIVELNHLAALLRVATPSDTREPPAEVARMVAVGAAFSARAFQVAPGVVRVLAALDSPADLNHVADLWDESSRTVFAGYGASSWQECRALLGQIVDIAQDALSSERQLYVVESLPRASRPRCGGTDCAGYACGQRLTDSGAGQPICHDQNDECQTQLDCPPRAFCAFDPSADRFACLPEP